MDIDAIARKVFPELYADDEGKGRLYALEQVEDVLDAAGVPEMEKALDRAGEWVSKVKVAEMPGVGDTQGWLLRVIEGALSSAAGRNLLAQKQAAEKVREAAKAAINNDYCLPAKECSECGGAGFCMFELVRDALREWEASCLSCDKRVSCEEVCQELEVPTDA
jgi:TPP-dependent indolepyruvate ferredoxin oxidoreductase alpha subunit